MQPLERPHPGYGIAIVRIVAGIILVLAGYAKWTGPGVVGITGFFGNVGIPAPNIMAPLLMSFEVLGGLFLILGLLSRFVGAAMIVEFLVAGLAVSLPSQMGWNAARLDLLLAACGALFLFAGSGLLSADSLLMGRRGRGAAVGAPSF